MIIDEKLIEKLSKMSMLELSPAEKERYLNDLKNILWHFENLNSTKTDNINSISQVTWLENVMREDKIIESQNYKDLLWQAPESLESWAILVKNVL